MINRPHFIHAFSALMLVTLACGLSFTPDSGGVQPSVNELETAVARGIAETSVLQTAIAIGVAGTLNPSQQIIQPEIPSLTPSITITTTSEKVMLTVSQVTNCRKGPGAVYDWVGALEPGEQAEVIARDPFGLDWYIRNPDDPNGFCWIFGEFATVTGNSGALPAFTAIPTPARTSTPTTPAMDFTISRIWIVDCSFGGAGEYWVNFEIANSGSLTWQSWQVQLADMATLQTKTTGWDIFHDTTGCASGPLQDDLMPGETGGAYSGDFANNPSGHLMSGTIRLCSQNGMLGTCVNKDLHFTP